MRGASYHHHMESSIADRVVFASIGRALKDYAQIPNNAANAVIADQATDIDGATALHAAAASGDVTSTTLLLAARAPVDPVDSQGRSPLHLSCIADHAQCAALLIAHNAELDRRDACANKATPLITAVAHDSLACVRLLCEAGASVNMNADDCKSPMCALASRTSPPVAHLPYLTSLALSCWHAHPHATADLPRCRYTACQRGHLEIAQLLSSFGADRGCTWSLCTLPRLTPPTAGL